MTLNQITARLNRAAQLIGEAKVLGTSSTVDGEVTVHLRLADLQRIFVGKLCEVTHDDRHCVLIDGCKFVAMGDPRTPSKRTVTL